MRFPESRMSLEAALPWSDSVHSWLGHQLELRGIDSIIYTRYVITLLQQDVSELENSEREDLWERRAEAKRNKDKKEGKKKSCSVSEEDKRKTAAVECLLSVSDEESDIENLVDELCARLKETRCEREYFAPLSINVNDATDDRTEIEIVESQDPAERYYAAFPALPGEGSPQNVSPSLTEDNVWRRNPFTGTLAGDTYESKDKNDDGDDKKSPPAFEKYSHNVNKKVSTNTKLRDEKENHHPQPKFKNQRKASPGGNKVKQNAKKGNFEGKNRKGAHLLNWQFTGQDSIAKESFLSAEHKSDSLDPKEEQYCNMVENMLKELLLGEKEKCHFSRMEKYFPSPNYKYSSIPQWYEENIYNREFLENDDWYTKPLENIFATPVSKAQRLYKRHSYPPAVFSCDERLNWEDLFPDPVLYLEKPEESYQCNSPDANSEDVESSKDVTKSDAEIGCTIQDNKVVHCEDHLEEASRAGLDEVHQPEVDGFFTGQNTDVTSTVQSFPLVCVHSDSEPNTSGNLVDVAVAESDGIVFSNLSAPLSIGKEEDETDVIDDLLKSVEKHWDTYTISNDASSTVSSSDKGCLSDTTEVSPCITDVSQQASPFPDMLLLLNYGEDSRSEPGVRLVNSDDDDNNFATLVDLQNVFGPNSTEFESNILEDVQWDNTSSRQDLGKEWLPYNMRSCSLSQVFEDEAGGGEDYFRIQRTLECCFLERNDQSDNISAEKLPGKEFFPFTVHTCSSSDDTDASGESFVDVKCMLASCQEMDCPHLKDAFSVLFNLESDDDDNDDTFVENKDQVLEQLPAIGSGREGEIDESACFPTDLLSSFGPVGDYSGNSDCLLFGLPQLVDTSYLLDLFGLSETGPRVSRSPAFLFHLTPVNEGGSSCWHNRVFLDEFECSLSFEEFCQSSPRMFWDDLLKNEMSNVEGRSQGQQTVKPLYHLWDVNSNKKVPPMSDTSDVWNSILSLCVLTPEYTVGDDIFSSQSHETGDSAAFAIEDSVLDLQFLEEFGENKHYLYDRSFFEGSLPKFWHNSWTCESFDSAFGKNYGFVPSKNSAFMGVVPRAFHHVQSAPNLTYSRLLSPLMGTDNFEKTRQPPYSPTEHLYFSSETHFRPIQTPVGTPDAEYQPNDLFGGASASTGTPYQQYRDVTDEQEMKFRPKFKILKYLDKYIQTGSSLDENSVPGSDMVVVLCAAAAQECSENTLDLPAVTQEQTAVVIAKEKTEEGSVTDFLQETENPSLEKYKEDNESVLSVPPGFEKLAASQSFIINDGEGDKVQPDGNNMIGTDGIIFHDAVVGPLSNWKEDLTDSSDTCSPENPGESECEASQVIFGDKSEHSDVFTQDEENAGKQDLCLWDLPQPSEGDSIWMPLQSTVEKSESVDVKMRSDVGNIWKSSYEMEDEAGSIWKVPSETKDESDGIWNMPTSEIENEAQNIWDLPPREVENDAQSIWKISTSETDNETTVQCMPFLKWAFSVESDYEVNIESIWQPPGSCNSTDHLDWDNKLGQDNIIAVSHNSVWAVREMKDQISSVENTALKDIWASESRTESIKHPSDKEEYDLLTANYSGEPSWSAGYEKAYSHNEKNNFFLAPEKEESPIGHCFQSDEQSNMYYTEGEPASPSKTVCKMREFCDDGEGDSVKTHHSNDLYNYYLQNYPEMESFVLSSDLEECTEKQDYDFGSLVPIPQQAVFSSDLEKQWLDKKSHAVIDNRRRSQKNRIFKGGSRKPCSFFLDGNCRRSDCKFSHDISNITCRFWEAGQCFKGSLCPFLHGYPSDVSSSSPDVQVQLSKEQFPELERSAKCLVKPPQSQKMARKRQVQKEFLKKDLTIRKEGSASKHELTVVGSVH